MVSLKKQNDGMAKRKKLFFIDPMSYGTIAQYDQCLLGGLRNKSDGELEITYICSCHNPFEKIESMKEHRLFFYNKMKLGLFKGFSYFVSSLMTLILIVIKHPDYIHIQWIRIPDFDYKILKLIKFFGGEVIYTAHNLLPHNDNKKSTEIKYDKYYSLVDKILVHSEYTKSEMIEKFGINPSKIFTVRHGLLPIEIPEEKIKSTTERIKSSIDLNGKIILTCLGMQSPYKGTDLIINAWNKYSELNSNKNIILIIAGKSKGIDFGSLKKYSNVVVVDNYISDEEYLSYLRLSSITLLPYRSISQSGALLTALSECVPVLVSHVGGLTDPLSVADIGWDFGVPNEENLASKLIELVSNPMEIKNKKENHKEWEKIKHGFSWDGIGRDILKVYKEKCL